MIKLKNGSAETALLTRFMRDERGATAIEYGLILALLSIVVGTAVTTIGTSLTAMFQKLVDIFA